MKNKTPYIIIAIFFVLFNTIAFLLPSNKSTSFWIAYVFTLIAFVVQIFIWRLSFVKQESIKSKFLGIPLIHISSIYLIVQLIISAVMMFVPRFPAWASALLCVIALGVSAVLLIAVNTGTGSITTIEKKTSQKRMYIKTLQIDIEMLAEQESDPTIKEQLTALGKKIRLSDPMSDDSLSVIEDNISSIVAGFNNTDKSAAIKEIELLLNRRNKMVMALKG